MGYRHYLGYIKKKNLPKIMEKVKSIKAKIGTVRDAKLEENWSMYDVTSYLSNKAVCLTEIGKLYYSNTDDIYNCLYAHKTEDYSNEDTEFFFIDDDKIFNRLCLIYYKKWSQFMKNCQEALSKVLAGKKLTKDDTYMLEELRKSCNMESGVIYSDEDLINNAKLTPYFEWQYNYEATEMHSLAKNINLKDKVLCVFAY